MTATSPATRKKLSAAMKGKRNAAGPHNVTAAGHEGISRAQVQRWDAYRAARDLQQESR